MWERCTDRSRRDRGIGHSQGRLVRSTTVSRSPNTTLARVGTVCLKQTRVAAP